ncbi:hypothetical protein DFQ27_001881 [Actinomortierella ambigua]|uniref:LUD domain-containing protein n=1 Tax=Actinomortierella ambigua TaxID=1343610 RepID=A0A9P6Q8W0_9FUNG|nr:hypothetical protein DFQ27_001881 [Actinomortierella ambigua]
MPSLISRVKNIFKSNSKDHVSQTNAAHTAASAPTRSAPAPAPAPAPRPAARPAAPAAPVAAAAAIPAVTVTQTRAAATHPKNEHEKHTRAALLKSDAQLAASGLANSPYSQPASQERFQTAKAGLEAKGFKVHVAQNKSEAFNTLKSLIPKGASVNNAHSTTLEEIGFITYLKGETEWDNVHAAILAETDRAKQAELRRTKGSTVDYYLTSMAAVTENGEMAHGDLSGSKVGGVAFGAGNVIVIVGSNKIVKDLDEAEKRTREFALPFESARSRDAYGVPGSALVHYETIANPSPFNTNRVQVVLVNEALGF